MIPSNIPLAIALLRRVHAQFSSHATYICHELPRAAHNPEELKVAGELVDYIQTTLTNDTPDSVGERILEEVIPRLPTPGYCDLRYKVHVEAKLDELIRMAWLDKMVYDLETMGALP